MNEFVSGVWMWEFWPPSTATTRRSWPSCTSRGSIRRTGQQAAAVMHREVQEELFFHADPHPANLVVLPDNRICFIDFGAIGRFSTQTRKCCAK